MIDFVVRVVWIVAQKKRTHMRVCARIYYTNTHTHTEREREREGELRAHLLYYILVFAYNA